MFITNDTLVKIMDSIIYWLLVSELIFPGVGKPEKAGGDNPAAHGRVRDHHHEAAGTFKAPRNTTLHSAVIYSSIKEYKGSAESTAAPTWSSQHT